MLVKLEVLTMLFTEMKMVSMKLLYMSITCQWPFKEADGAFWGTEEQ